MNAIDNYLSNSFKTLLYLEIILGLLLVFNIPFLNITIARVLPVFISFLILCKGMLDKIFPSIFIVSIFCFLSTFATFYIGIFSFVPYAKEFLYLLIAFAFLTLLKDTNELSKLFVENFYIFVVLALIWSSYVFLNSNSIWNNQKFTDVPEVYIHINIVFSVIILNIFALKLNKRQTYLLFLTNILLLIVFYISDSRGPFIAILVSSAGLLFSKIDNKIFKLIFLYIFILIGTLFIIQNFSYIQTFLFRDIRDIDDIPRVFEINYFLSNLEFKNLIFGYGIGSLLENPFYYELSGVESRYYDALHNGFFHVLYNQIP